MIQCKRYLRYFSNELQTPTTLSTPLALQHGTQTQTRSPFHTLPHSTVDEFNQTTKDQSPRDARYQCVNGSRPLLLNTLGQQKQSSIKFAFESCAKYSQIDYVI
jgi:hypothetical protein